MLVHHLNTDIVSMDIEQYHHTLVREVFGVGVVLINNKFIRPTSREVLEDMNGLMVDDRMACE